MLERLNEEIKRRTHVVRIFPNEQSCLRLVRALAVETHENWIEAHRYLDMNLLKESRKQELMPESGKFVEIALLRNPECQQKMDDAHPELVADHLPAGDIF